MSRRITPLLRSRLLSQYIPPSPETKTLTAGGTISFTRPYTPITLSACAVGVVGCSQSISFAVTTGSVGPIAPQGIAVSSNAPSLPFTATASSSGSGQSWLSLLPTTGTAPATLSVSVSPNLTPGTYSAQITIAAQQATNSPQQLSVALTVTAGPPVFVAVRPFVIPAAPAAEPSIAANPKNPMHAVVGFNGRQDGNATCGWAETTDGGQTWTAGVVGFVDGFTAIGDPWLRYSEDGQLFYSCMATKGSLGASVVGVFVARARTGSAAQFEPAAPIETVFRDCSSLIGPCGLNDEIDDHPAIGVLQLATGKRIVACWVNTTTSDSGGTAFLYVGHSPDGKLWLETQVLAGPIVGTCTIGGGQSELAVTWRQIIRGDSGEQTDVVRVSTTRDGLNWTAPQTLGAVGALVNPSKDQSTTARVVSPPYAVSSITSRGLRVIWQARSSGSSQLFYADEGDGWIAKSLLLSTLDHFLPSAGDCRHTLGFYEAVVDSPTLFRYTIWSQDQAGSYSLALLSDILDGQYGDGDSRFLLKRIGDYTGMSCSSKAVWAVWTTPVPPSTTVPAHNEVKGVRLIMPSGTR